METSEAGDLIRVVVLLGAAVVAVPLFKRIGLGSVLGYLAAGLIIGPFGLKLVTDSHAILHIAEFGVVMFLFVIGLEMKPSHLWSLRRQIFGLGSLQVILSALVMTIVSAQFGVSWEIAFVCSSGFVLTSTAIVMQVLGERKALSTKPGQKMVSILLFEDLLIVPLLAIITFLSPLEKTEQSMPWWESAGIAMLALAALVFIGRFILNPNMIKGFNEYGIKSYFGDASRREFLIAAGLEQAELLVVAIDNKQQAADIIHFAREINPNIKIIARAYDRFNTFQLYRSGANEVIRETFDSAVRCGKYALEALGMAPETVKKIGDYYFDADRHEVALMSNVYDPNTGLFQNPLMRDIARECDQKMAAEIQAIILQAKEESAQE